MLACLALTSTARAAGPSTASTRPAIAPPVFERALFLASAAAMLAVVIGNRRAFADASPDERRRDAPAPAPLARRFASQVIDLLPFAGVCAYLILDERLTLFAGTLRFADGSAEILLAAGLVFTLLLQLAGELRWSASVGKAVFALRVVDLAGRPAASRAILVRNALRLVDLNLVTLLFVPLTPRRQRLGDVLAGTMVVDAADVRADDAAAVADGASRSGDDPADP